MKHTLDRSAVQLVLCQKIMEMDVEELTAAFRRATGEPLKEGKHDDTENYRARSSLPDLIEDRSVLDRWLQHMRDVCQQRLS
jgi:hypothetical protein